MNKNVHLDQIHWEALGMKQGGIVLGVECVIIHQDCAHASRASSGTDVSIKRCSSSGGSDVKGVQYKKREA